MGNGKTQSIMLALTALLTVKNVKMEYHVNYATRIIIGMELSVHKHVIQDIIKIIPQEHARNVWIIVRAA